MFIVLCPVLSRKLLIMYVFCLHCLFRFFFDAGTMPVAGGTSQYAAGSVVYPPAVPPVAAGVLGMPDLTYSPMPPDARSPMPSAPIPLSSLPVNLSSPSQPPLYQPSPLPAGTVPGSSAPSDMMSGVGGPPPPPPTAGFVPSHGIVTATPGKVSSSFVVCSSRLLTYTVIFYPCNAMLAKYWLSTHVCLCCVKTAALIRLFLTFKLSLATLLKEIWLSPVHKNDTFLWNLFSNSGLGKILPWQVLVSLISMTAVSS